MVTFVLFAEIELIHRLSCSFVRKECSFIMELMSQLIPFNDKASWMICVIVDLPTPALPVIFTLISFELLLILNFLKVGTRWWNRTTPRPYLGKCS